MARELKTGKKPIEQYDHKDKKRVNNPPVGLVTPELDRESRLFDRIEDDRNSNFEK